ncbi:MAG: type I glyceraldehyde-3-phosphate dehydrogenase [Fluviicola sp.]|jgi:glyceraldehyde 3-phosphate dehydrogenase|nr:type I glyceraldehyde-3-phosphate dehydrogenase [Fluviicola sp.]
MKQIGINGFGRIGRYFTRLALDRNDINVTVINDLADVKTLAHLLKYDSVHGKLNHPFTIQDNKIVFENGKEILFIKERNPELIPWKEYGVEIVLESTGLFLSHDDASKHLVGGAKKVIISAPAKTEDVKTVVLGVNDQLLEDSDVIVSNASCTTNSAAPLIKVLLELGEIESAFINTVHSYTSDQRLHDAPHSDFRRARAANLSIVPTTTGAAKAITKIFPELEGKMGGGGMRVPVPDGSLTDLTVVMKNPLTVDQINEAMKKAANSTLKNILAYTDEPLVSIDIVGNPHSCIYDSELTSVIGNMVKIVGWYDNEAGYSNRLIDLAIKL